MSDPVNVYRDGKLIATIHDPAAFNLLIDEFEADTRMYGRMGSAGEIMTLATYGGLNSHISGELQRTSEMLNELRHQLGDTRQGRYPTDPQEIMDRAFEETRRKQQDAPK